MKIWVLSHLQNSPGNRILVEAVRARGHAVTLVAPRELAANISRKSRDVLHDAAGPRALPDAVLTRMGASAPLAALDVLRQLELTGIPCHNKAQPIRRSRDKVGCFLELAAADLPLPNSVLLGGEVDTGLAAEILGPPPWILKLPLSTQGAGVMIVESLRSLRSAVDLLRSQDSRILVQAFIKEAAGSDLRVLVVGGQALTAMRRTAQGNEFRSNLHQGGSAKPVELTEQAAAVAVKSAAVLGLDIAGVDLLETSSGPLVLEVNASPGLEGIESATGRSLSDEIVAWLEDQCAG